MKEIKKRKRNLDYIPFFFLLFPAAASGSSVWFAAAWLSLTVCMNDLMLVSTEGIPKSTLATLILTVPCLSALYSILPAASLILSANSSPSATPPRLATGMRPLGPKNLARVLETAGIIPGVARHLVGWILPLNTASNNSSPPTYAAPASLAKVAEGEDGSAKTRIVSDVLRGSRGRMKEPRIGSADLWDLVWSVNE